MPRKKQAVEVIAVRINKFISETGVCSRREADSWIAAGRVSINGHVATLGSKVEANDIVHVDGQPIGAKRTHVYLALNKPVGITCTSEPHIKGNIVEFVNYPERIFPIGRLDKDSEGLILLTNNGDIVNQVLRVENAHEKEYLVTVDRPITQAFLHGMASGVRILGTLTRPCVITRVNERSFKIILTQGLNRQIRRMCAAFDYKVRCLQRLRIMHIELGNLKLGQWRALTPSEVRALGVNK